MIHLGIFSTHLPYFIMGVAYVLYFFFNLFNQTILNENVEVVKECAPKVIEVVDSYITDDEDNNYNYTDYFKVAGDYSFPGHSVYLEFSCVEPPVFSQPLSIRINKSCLFLRPPPCYSMC